MNSTLAFRLFGDFQWPPTETNADGNDNNRKRGVVEIWFCPVEESNEHRALLRWVPADRFTFDSALEIPTSTENVYAKNVDLKKIFTNADAPILIWISDGPSAKAKGTKLRFRGGCAFQQLLDPKHTWPLVREFQYRKTNSKLYAELVVGQDGDDAYGVTAPSRQFRLSLSLPTPITQTRNGLRVFAFSCIFESSVKEQDDCGKVTRFVARAFNKTCRVVVPVNGFRLGSLGFSLLGLPKNGFLSFLDDENGGKANPAGKEGFWPLADDPALECLNRLGFETSALLTQGIEVPERDNVPPEHLSIQFNDPPAADSSERPSELNYRISLKANGKCKQGALQIEGGSFFLNLPQGSDRRLRLGKVIRVNLRLKWELGSPFLEEWLGDWEQKKVKCFPATLETALLWEHGPTEDQKGDENETQHDWSVPQAVKDAVSAVHQSLIEVAGAQPVSLLPKLRISESQKEVDFVLTGTEIEMRTPLGQSHDWVPPSGHPKLRGSLAREDDYMNLGSHVTDQEIQCRAQFPQFDESQPPTELDLSLQPRAELWPAKDDGNTASRWPTGALLVFNMRETTETKGTIVGRLGALRFETASHDKTARNKKSIVVDSGSYLAVSPRRTDSTAPAASAVSLELGLRVQVARVTPLTADVLPGEREASAPLLVPLDEESSASFVLEATERTADRKDWQLTAELFDAQPGSSPRVDSYTMLSDVPFGLYRFTRQPLAASGDGGTSIVASFDSDTRTWLFKRSSRYYRFALPAQGIGESTDKPRRLEILDLSGDTTNHDFVRPYPVGTDGSPVEGKTHQVEYRLTPSAEVWIEPTDLPRNYVLPEWAAQDILRQRGDFGPGTALRALRGEFLYGLSVGVETAEETGPARRARITEIQALMGDTRGGAEQEDKVSKRWQDVRRALRTRSERLEVWSPDPGDDRLFAPARFTRGVRFALRRRALHRPPVPPPEQSPGHTPDANPGPRYHPQGLPGGVLWPLEFWAPFQSLLDDPKSSGGVLENVALSPTGGDADQEASFLNGIMRVISETRGGFVQRQRVEILGRIAAHWHRAKHVVVYERTVNPSAQFAPEPETGDWHKRRTRRPVLRKVKEYVEVLQPVRRYPDLGGDSTTSGFLDSIRYNSTVINVDSAWGSDVAGVGYVIPLWNRRSATLRPQVYPKPDIAFVTKAEGTDPDACVAQECEDPEHLYFFTDIGSGNPDTDSWRARVGIDGAEILPASKMLEWVDVESPAAGEDLADRRKPPVSRFMPGARRFTWRLLPGSARTQLNARRGERPIYAGLESISLMRAVPASFGSKAEAQTKLLKALQTFANDGGVPTWNGSGPIPGQSPVAQMGRDYRALLESLGQSSPSEKAAEVLVARIQDLLEREGSRFRSLVDVAASANQVGPPAGPNCQSLVDDAVDAITRKRLLIRQNLQAWQEQLGATLNRLVTAPTAGSQADAYRNDVRTAIQKSLSQQLSPALSASYAAVDRIENDIEQAKHILREAQADIEQGLERALVRADALAAAYRDGKPWSANRLMEFERKVRAELEALYGEAEAAINEAGERLSLELSAWAHGLATILTRAMIESIQPLYALEALATSTPRPTAVLVAPIRGALERFSADGGYLERADAAVQQIRHTTGDTHKQLLDGLSTAIRTLREGVDSLQKALTEVETHPLEERGIARLLVLLNGIRTTALSVGGSAVAMVVQLRNVSQKVTGEAVGSSLEALRAIAAVTGVLAEGLSRWPKEALTDVGGWIDPSVAALHHYLRLLMHETRRGSAKWHEKAEKWRSDLRESVDALTPKLEPAKLFDERVVEPFLTGTLDRVPLSKYQEVINGGDLAKLRDALKVALTYVTNAIADNGGLMDTVSKEVPAEISNACKALTGAYDGAAGELTKAAAVVDTLVVEARAQLEQIKKALNNPAEALGLARALGTQLGSVVEGIGTGSEHARAYGRRVFEAAANIGSGGAGTVPGNILRLYSAATSAPELAMLESNIGRIRCAFEELDKTVSTTRARMWFARLGDALKSLGLEIHIDGFGDTFRLDKDALKKFDLSRLFRNFGGLKLDGLFRGLSLPDAGNAVRVSHDFDRKQARAWVQVDVAVPVTGRHELFGAGPFAMYFRDTTLTARVRLEASKDARDVEETGYSSIVTSIEAVAAGQPLVTLERAEISYSRENGLKVDLNPQNIRLNEVFRFVQDTFGNLFPDEVGGLAVIKERGVPVGVEHDFRLPNLSLAFGTSGVSNIQLSNRFRLVAVPDFIIANRFNLSTPELPFLFTIFIIGGTGYIQVDAEYRPFDQRLAVVVEAAAGGSAALAFAFGPVSGSVFMALSVALTYRKLIGSAGGGLSVSLVLVVAGTVSLWGLVSVYLGLILRMTYHDSGAITAQGDLCAEVRVSRFFTLRYRTTVHYTLRQAQGRPSQSMRLASAGSGRGSGTFDDLRQRAIRLNGARG